MHIAGEYVYIYIYICISNSFILQANIYISRQLMHIAGQYIYGIHSYCRRISLYLASSCILQANMYIYIYGQDVHMD